MLLVCFLYLSDNYDNEIMSLKALSNFGLHCSSAKMCGTLAVNTRTNHELQLLAADSDGYIQIFLNFIRLRSISMNVLKFIFFV